MEFMVRTNVVLCQDLNLGLSVIPAQAGIQFPSLDPRLRGNDALKKGSGTNSQMARRVLRTIGSRPLF